MPTGPKTASKKLQVLSLCDLSGVMVKPWLDAGHNATVIDLQHPSGFTKIGDLTKIGANILDVDYVHHIGWDIVFAFPPCTHLANSGARWFQDKGLTELISALTVVNKCREICESSGAPYMIENPVGQLSTYWRPPDHYFDPYEYGGYVSPSTDAYTKKTCLWIGGGFVLPQAKPVPVTQGSKMHLMPPGPNRANLRSITPSGFAKAVYSANCAALCR